jgi:hypothetical protein
MRFFPFLILCIHFAGFSQKTYKVEYAYKLSNELDFSSAYPVWEEISESFLSTKKGEWEYVRMTVDAAEKTEQFEKALYYDSLLVGSSSANIFSCWLLTISMDNFPKRLILHESTFPIMQK